MKNYSNGKFSLWAMDMGTGCKPKSDSLYCSTGDSYLISGWAGCDGSIYAADDSVFILWDKDKELKYRKNFHGIDIENITCAHTGKQYALSLSNYYYVKGN